MSTSSAMSPYWVEWHKENTFKNCETSSLELAPVAFPSLPIDQPRPVKDVRSRVDTVDFIRQQERKESRLVRDTPLKARDPSRSVRCHPEASHARGTKKAHESNESGLIFEPSPLRDPGEINIVSKEKWQTLELWYALPPFDLRKARSAIQVERKRLTAEGTLQVRAFLPKKDSTCEFTTLEKLVAQRKLLETKLQMLKYKGAKLLNPDKPSKLPRALSGIRLSFEEQRIRSINQRLALEVNQLLEHAKYKHHFSSIPSKRGNLPLKGSFAALSAHATNVATVRYQNLGHNNLVGLEKKTKARSRCTREPGPPRNSLDWPAPEDMAQFEDLDATDIEDWDSPEFTEPSVAAWN